MRAIMVMFDSLNRLHLPPYGCDWIHAPNFRRLAERSATFERCYVGSMPCMPARRELHTGRYNFLHRGWGPLEPFDDSMPELLRSSGVYAHLATDHYHYFEDGGATYHNRFSTWECFRGQEGDPWIGQVADPDAEASLDGRGLENRHWRQDQINRRFLARDADMPQVKTFDAGCDFIMRNAREDGWFLQVETFDPHEPFFTQEHWKDLYPDDWSGPRFDWPPYREVREEPAAVAHARNWYNALVSMCDHQLGRILDLMDALRLWDDTMLIVCTDHGFLLGEHGDWAKVWTYFYEEVAHTPLFVWDPRCRVTGVRRRSLVQTVDLAPTILDFFGLQPSEHMRGRVLRDTIARDAPARDVALFGVFGGQLGITDGRRVHLRSPDRQRPLHEYTLMPTRMRSFIERDSLARAELHPGFGFTKGLKVLRLPGGGWLRQDAESRLYDLEADPRQERPLDDAGAVERLCALAVREMAAHEAPPEAYERFALAVPAGR